VYVPPAEPHVLISDLYKNPQDWYSISQLIPEFAIQSFASYYRGLFFASFSLSTNCLELILKYELLRNGLIEPLELEKNFTFGTAIKQIVQLGLEKYKNRLEIANNLRNGMYHYNSKKLRDSLYSIDGGIFEELQDNDFLPNISYLLENTELSKVAFFTYSLMYDMTNELYGEANRIKYVKADLDDYHRTKNLHS
jgi:hypothetical protein